MPWFSRLWRESVRQTVSVSIHMKLTGLVLFLLVACACVVVLELPGATALLLLTTGCALIAIVGSWLLSSLVIKPLRDLAQASEAIRSGDLQRRVPVWGGDEVGQLGESFNAMAEALARSRSELEEANLQLLKRNAELSVANAVAAALSESWELVHILKSALGVVLALMQFKAGWVFLRNAQSGRLSLAVSSGFSEPPVKEIVGNAPDACVCRQTLETGRAHVVADIPACLNPSRATFERDGLACHIGIPLRARDKPMGVMGLAFSRDRQLTDGDVELLTSVGRQIGMAVENARLVEELHGKDEFQRHLLNRLICAHEEERTRVARELHDGAGQSLTALLMRLGNLETMLADGAEPAKQCVGEIESMLAAVVDEIRRLMMDLRPALLDDLGLIPAIRSYADAQLTRARVNFHVDVEGVKRKLSPAMEIALFRILQEGITNIAKHASAATAWIRLRFKESSIEAAIEDDGRGFDPVRSRTNWNALGLLGVEERVTLLGGTLRIDSVEGHGTRIALEIPTLRE
jgi:signal transduction histidine kinase